MPTTCKYNKNRIIPVEFTWDEEFKSLITTNRYNIILVNSGIVCLEINNNYCSFVAPCVICLNNNSSVKLISTKKATACTITFDPRFINLNISFEIVDSGDYEQLVERYGFISLYIFNIDFISYFGYLPLDLSSNVRLTEWFHGFGKEIEVQSDIKWSCRARSFLLEIVIMLNKIYQEFVLDGKEITNTVINGNYVELALNYIHSNYPDNIKVDDLVRLVNVNKTTLNDKFKLRTGFPIMEYILNYRIDLACSTLRLTDLNLSEIAYMCGFNHETYFIKQFKKRKGLTPTQFRKNAVKDRKETLGPFNK